MTKEESLAASTTVMVFPVSPAKCQQCSDGGSRQSILRGLVVTSDPATNHGMLEMKLILSLILLDKVFVTVFRNM